MAMGAEDYAKLAFVRRGQGALHAGEPPVALSRGRLVLVPAGVSHRFADDPIQPLTLVVICFHEHVFAGNPQTEAILKGFQKSFPSMSPFDLRSSHRHSEIMRRLRGMLFEQARGRSDSGALIWCHLLELLVFLGRAWTECEVRRSLSSREQAFARSLSWLDDNFTEAVRVGDLASIADMSYRNYTTEFRRRTGRSVPRYVSELRVAYAQRRMLETGNILFSSLEAGFGDLAHFYRVFKTLTGTTPKRFIDAHGQEEAKT